jgi:hypothetical protein
VALPVTVAPSVFLLPNTTVELVGAVTVELDAVITSKHSSVDVSELAL